MKKSRTEGGTSPKQKMPSLWIVVVHGHLAPIKEMSKKTHSILAGNG